MISRVVDRVLWWLSHVIVLPLLHLPPLRMRRVNHEVVPRTGPLLLVCNHVSVADPLVLTAAARPRRTAMMAKAELFKNPVFAALLRTCRAFPIKRNQVDVGAVRHALALLEEGHSLVVFPEGHVSRTGHMRRGHVGAGFFSLRPGVVTIPCAVWDTQLFRGPARVVFGEPIDMSDIPPGPRKQRNRAATDRIMAVLCDMVTEIGGPLQPPPAGDPQAEDRRKGRVTPRPFEQPVA